jgi:hypothetical protein
MTSVERPVSALRQRMLEDMAMRGLRISNAYGIVTDPLFPRNLNWEAHGKLPRPFSHKKDPAIEVRGAEAALKPLDMTPSATAPLRETAALEGSFSRQAC